MSLRLSVSAAALLLSSSLAMAADLAPTPAEPVAPVALPFTWTGFYLGVNAGYNWGTGDQTVEGDDFVNGLVDSGLLPGSYGLDLDSFAFGAQAGFNYQINQFVLGIEGDWSYLNADDSASSNVDFSSGGTMPIVVNYKTTAETKLDWLATLRGRAGFAIDRLLVYGTGGLAFGDVEATGTINVDDGSVSWSGDDSSTQVGWTIGGGLEYAFTDHITVKGEYLYYDLGDFDYTSNTVNLGTTTSPDNVSFTRNVEVDGNIVRVGLNYKF